MARLLRRHSRTRLPSRVLALSATGAAIAAIAQARVDLVGLQSDLGETVDLALRPSSTGIWIRTARTRAPARGS